MRPLRSTRPRADAGASLLVVLIAAQVPLALLAECADAQDQGPITITRKQQYESVVLTEFDAALRFEYRFDNDVVEREDGTEERDTEQRFREILELGTTGYAGHPNLFEFHLAGELWFSQTDVDLGQGEGNRSNQLLLDYDARGTFLRESDLPLTLYGKQTISDVDRQFGGTLLNTVTEYGVQLDIRSDTFPTRIEAFRREVEQEDALGDTDFFIEQYTVQADGRGAYAENQQLWWDASYDTVKESGTLRTPQDFDRFEANVTHTLNFGGDEQHQLRSTGRAYRESGDRDFSQYRISERLRFEHSESLNSRLEYTGELIERDSFEQTRHEITGLLQHQLYDSLLTTARAGYRHQRVPTDDFTSEELFGELNLDYTKLVPYGTFYSGLDVVGSQLTESSRGATIQVTGRLFVFDASGRVIINQRNIDPDSIVIRDASGLIIFTEGVDYTVIASPARIEIRRVLGGDISAGQAVQIDFDILPQPGGDTTTLGVGVEFRYTIDEGPLRGLSVYTRIFDQDEQRSEIFLEGEEFPENDFTDFVYGAEYNRDYVYGRVEYQIRDSSFDPFTAWRVEGRYLYRIGRGSSLVFNGLYQDLDRTEEDLRTQTLTLSARWNQRFNERLRGSLIVLWQYEQSSFGGDAQGYEQEANVRWHYGQTDVIARFRNTIRNTESDDRMFQTLFIGVRREF